MFVPHGVLLFCFFWHVSAARGTENSVREIDCKLDAYYSCNDYDKVCRVKCPATCPPDDRGQVYGTAQYTWDSAICVAAAHDLRLSPWNRTTLTVEFWWRRNDIANYRGSTRQGIRSLSYGAQGYHRKYGWYEFLSPRVEEPLQDVVSVHVRYRFAPGEDHVQYCFAPPQHEVRFSLILGNVNVNSQPSHNRGSPARRMIWPSSTDQRSQLGGFVCSVQGSVLSSVTSLAMPKSPLFPDQLSRTASLGQSVDLLSSKAEADWTKDGEPHRHQLLERGRRLYVSSALPGDAGLYVLNFGRLGKQAMRLVVRVCADGSYGHNCLLRCPDCLNGGVCHDITGVCVCPPGFMGDHCQRPCGEAQFGHNCNYNCSTVVEDAHRHSKCVGLLFCLPDPYGCSCYPGLQGVDCNMVCPEGKYGPDCRLQRNCYCQNGTNCHPHWGFCTTGTCQRGFRNGPYCDKHYPVLRSYEARNVDEENILVTWKPWSPDRDTGEGQAEAYRIIFKEHHGTEWNQTDLVVDNGNDTLSYVVEGLKANTEYDVRVVVHDSSGHENWQLPSTLRVTTPCGIPTEPPRNITADTSKPRMITVSWEIPDASTWQCFLVSVEVSVNGSNPIPLGFVHRYEFTTLPFTRYVLRVRLVAGADKVGEWSSSISVLTAEEAPDRVTHLTAYRISTKTYEVSWLPPLVTNGVIRSYALHCTLERDLTNCTTFVRPADIRLQVPANQTSVKLGNLTAAASYRVHVLATTVQNGDWETRSFSTSFEGEVGRERHD